MFLKGDLVTWYWRVADSHRFESETGVYLDTLRDDNGFVTYRVWTSKGIRYPKNYHGVARV